MEWDKKSVPTLALLLTTIATLIGATIYIVGSIHGVETRMCSRIECLEKDSAIIKTVLLLKVVMPPELAVNKQLES